MKNKMMELVLILSVAAMISTGCAGSTSNVTKDATKSGAGSNNQVTTEKVKVDTETETTKKATSDKTSSETKSNTTTTSETATKDILDTIKTDAQSGKVINCDYQANESVTLSDIETAWGKGDAQAEWVPGADGYYETFSAKKLTFGANKGDAVFEIRSFDDSIKKITLSELKAKYGTPDYSVTVNKEQIVGYVVNSDYKLLFVFPENSTDESKLTLDHYSVLYPAGTVNSMQGDAGREW